MRQEKKQTTTLFKMQQYVYNLKINEFEYFLLISLVLHYINGKFNKFIVYLHIYANVVDSLVNLQFCTWELSMCSRYLSTSLDHYEIVIFPYINMSSKAQFTYQTTWFICNDNNFHEMCKSLINAQVRYKLLLNINFLLMERKHVSKCSYQNILFFLVLF